MECVPPMSDDLQQLLHTVQDLRRFDPEKWIEKKVELVNDYFVRCGLKGAVVNMSGGVDSSVTFALISRAMKAPGSSIMKLLGITQPIHSSSHIQNRAYLMKDFGDIVEVDQTSVFDSLHPLVESALKLEPTEFGLGQLKSYMRTPVAFYASQCLSASGIPSVVIGTGNMDEDGFLYYFCKAGDGVADLQFIGDLHKSEVFQVGAKLGVPDAILAAPPSADLWSGQTDADELGFSYDWVELYTELVKMDKSEQERLLSKLSNESYSLFRKIADSIWTVHRRNLHKAHYPLNINAIDTPDISAAQLDLPERE